MSMMHTANQMMNRLIPVVPISNLLWNIITDQMPLQSRVEKAFSFGLNSDLFCDH